MSPLIQTRRECLKVADVEHVKVFGDKDTFAGWPFNSGFEQYGDGNELVVFYARYRCRIKVRPDGSKAYWTGPHPDSGRRRSRDGGKIWKQPVSSTKAGTGC